MNYYEVIRRPIYTEKAVGMKEDARTLCFEVHVDATKTQIAEAVSKLFGIKIEGIRTVNQVGKLRRRGRSSGYKADWKKAYVKLKEGETIPEFAEV
ncbi:MAG: 50S ribosomal protein L23 [Acidobacteria bacterium]|nr:50S ribosomal protein L23 [Acidobacteriota bacterium]